MRPWMVWGAFAAVLGAAFAAFSLQDPEYVRVEVRYRGTPPAVPRTFTVHEQWVPSRRIPLVSTRWGGFFEGWYPRWETSSETIPAGPDGFTATLNIKRRFSPGRYAMHAELESDAEGARTKTDFQTFLTGGSPRITLADGVLEAEAHFLDLATSETTFQVPLLWTEEVRTSRVRIDFDPIVYTSTLGLPHHQSWSQFGHRCGDGQQVLVSPGIPRTLRYEVKVFPEPRPGQPIPSLSRETEAFALRDPGGVTERYTPAEWAALRSRALGPDTVKVSLDPGTKTMKIEVPPDPRNRDLFEGFYVVAFIGTPSVDDRVFGTDCVRLELERADLFNLAVYTDFEAMEGREFPSRLDSGSRCANPEASYRPHLRLKPGVPAKLTYQVHARQWSAEPEVGQPAPEPAGPTEVFLVPGEAVDKGGERVTPAEWDALRRQAVKADEVKIEHDPRARSISVTVNGPLDRDLALVAGTRSSWGRFFGFDCVRLDTGAGAGGR